MAPVATRKIRQRGKLADATGAGNASASSLVIEAALKKPDRRRRRSESEALTLARKEQSTMRASFAVTMLVWLGSSQLQAQNAPPQRCDTPEFRQFDFWIGDWDVTTNGQPAGTNLITLEEDGCVIHEHWKGSRGGTGQSFNFYTRTSKQWRQTWIDNSGNPLDLYGEYRDRKMTLTGKTPAARGSVIQRITFFDNPDGTVRQLWESSTDDGKTWVVAFDGLYRKRTS
jgi:hypothetical protein